ncbi:Cd209 antigen [Plakobranchus ocellatus]|uniref:Cd209 antigen n=1 Tax=Plakobranchus ocellatus TaxID=259542 RepID=A0AAV4B6R5_9GAST|nr:Cd209 antigen [Plakobranchus ocellatus]
MKSKRSKIRSLLTDSNFENNHSSQIRSVSQGRITAHKFEPSAGEKPLLTDSNHLEMIGKKTFFPASFGLVILMAFIHKGDTIGQALQLTMSLSSRPLLYPTLTCSINFDFMTTAEVEMLSISGPRPYSKKGDLEDLATISKWDPTPLPLNGLDDTVANVTGSFSDWKKELVISWKLPIFRLSQEYRCTAQGTDMNGQPVTAFETITVNTEESALDDARDADDFNLLSDRIDDLVANSSLQAEEDFHAIENQVRDLESSFALRFQDVETQVEKQRESMNSSAETVENLDKALQKIRQNLLDLQQSVTQLQQKNKDQAVVQRFFKASIPFDISGTFKGKIYFISKTVADFEIADAAASCEAYGGYLVEIDDTEELKFISDFASQRGKSVRIFTGANDRSREGHFVYYKSKKRVPSFLWNRGEPNNVLRSEDCTEIQGKLNDVTCGLPGKYICESQ